MNESGVQLSSIWTTLSLITTDNSKKPEKFQSNRFYAVINKNCFEHVLQERAEHKTSVVIITRELVIERFPGAVIRRELFSYMQNKWELRLLRFNVAMKWKRIETTEKCNLHCAFKHVSCHLHSLRIQLSVHDFF